MYCPPERNCSLNFLRSVFLGEKNLVQKANIQTITVPKYKEFSVKAAMAAIKTDDDIRYYFPEPEMQVRQLDRTWVYMSSIPSRATGSSKTSRRPRRLGWVRSWSRPLSS